MLDRILSAMRYYQIISVGCHEVSLDFGCAFIILEVSSECSVDNVVGNIVNARQVEHDGLIALPNPGVGVEAVEHLGIFEFNFDIGQVFGALAEVVDGVGFVYGWSDVSVFHDNLLKARVLGDVDFHGFSISFPVSLGESAYVGSVSFAPLVMIQLHVDFLDGLGCLNDEFATEKPQGVGPHPVGILFIWIGCHGDAHFVNLGGFFLEDVSLMRTI